MLQELAVQTGAARWAIGSMLFFLAAWVAVVIWLAGQRREDLEARARLPLEGDDARRLPALSERSESKGSPGPEA